MTQDQLNKANGLKKEIDKLESFIWKAERTWTGKIIKRETEFIFKSNPYGTIDSAEFNLDEKLKIKVLDVIREHLKELKKQLEEL